MAFKSDNGCFLNQEDEFESDQIACGYMKLMLIFPLNANALFNSYLLFIESFVPKAIIDTNGND